MRHDGHLVQRRLAVEEKHVAIVEVSLDDVSELELRRDPAAVAVLEILRPARFETDKVGTRVLVHAVPHALADGLDVVAGNHLRVGHHLGDVQRHAHLVDAQVGVGGDDGATAEVDALSERLPRKRPCFP